MDRTHVSPPALSDTISENLQIFLKSYVFSKSKEERLNKCFKCLDDIKKECLETGLDFDAVYLHGTPIAQLAFSVLAPKASRADRHAIVMKALALGASPLTTDSHQYTLVYAAASDNNVPLTKELLKLHQVKPVMTTRLNEPLFPAMMCLSDQTSDEMLHCLLECGLDPEEKDENGMGLSALDYATGSQLAYLKEWMLAQKEKQMLTELLPSQKEELPGVIDKVSKSSHQTRI